MLQTSIPFGRFLGVELRLHLSFPLTLLVAVVYSILFNGGPLRGLAVWLALCFAVLVREVARALAAAYVGLDLRAILLLPLGGVMAFAPGERRAGVAESSRAVSLTGPIANFAMGLLLLGASYALDPAVNLFQGPLISTAHLLRTVVFMQLILGSVSLLPASTLPIRQLLRVGGDGSKAGADGKATAGSPTGAPTRAFGFGTGLALAMIASGFVLMSLWLVMLGGFMLLTAQVHANPATSPEAEAILVSEVMLTDYTLLSTSDTLRDALQRTIHSVQDVFPVVRGNLLVGSIARQTIINGLRVEGDSYLQGLMTRKLLLASPTESLVMALRRSANLGASEFIPVVEGDALVGILTPYSLNRSVQLLQLSRTAADGQQGR